MALACSVAAGAAVAQESPIAGIWLPDASRSERFPRQPPFTDEGQRIVAEWRANRGTIVAVGALVPVSYVLVLYAMTPAPVSVVAPARELSMMVGVLFGWWLLGEADVGRRLAGSGLIAGGVIVLML